MARLLRVVPLLFALLLIACPTEDPPGDDDDTTGDEPPEPGEFQAGIATVVIPAPLGSPTVGFGQIGVDPSITPFADKYPGTTRQHGALVFRAVALSRGEGFEVVLVSGDLLGFGSQARLGVIEELEQRVGRNLDDALVIGCNHTHGGPGRWVDKTGPYELGFDSFHPEMFTRIADALADVVELALADLAPAELGHTIGSTSGAHNDRRCENNALDILQENPALPVLAVKRGGQLEALVMSYGYHGTVIDADELTLNGDMGGFVEMKVAEAFDHPVEVLFFNSWGGDQSPGDPDIDDEAVGALQPDGYDRLESLGAHVADTVAPLVDEIVFTDEPAISASTRYVAIDRDEIGYADDEFDYETGGVYCAQNIDGNCDDDTPMDELGYQLDEMCVPFPDDDPAPKVTPFTVGQLGELYFVTTNGEWSTSLADNVASGIWELTGSDQVMVVGYAQDYMGYSITEEDWWQGGYESGGAIWGPRQGDYLAQRVGEIFQAWYDPEFALPYAEPDPLPAWANYEFDPYAPEGALGIGEVAQDVPGTAGLTDVVTFVVQGGDPWLGLPVATLEQDTGGGFEPVLRPNGTAVDSNGYEFWIDLQTDPPYDEVMPAIRTFSWTYNFPVSHRVPSSVTDLSGSFRFRVTIPTDLEGGTTEAVTGSFTVDGAAAATSVVTPSMLLERDRR